MFKIKSPLRFTIWVLCLSLAFGVNPILASATPVHEGDGGGGPSDDGGGSPLPDPTPIPTATVTPAPTVTAQPSPTAIPTVTPSLPPSQPDLCLADPVKTEPGVCGCGVQDEDSNLNGIMDCQIQQEFAFRARIAHSNAKKIRNRLTAKNKLVQKALRKELRRELRDMILFQAANSLMIQASSPSVNLQKLTKRCSRKTRLMLRAGASDYQTARKLSLRSFKKLAKGLAGGVLVLR